MTVIKDTPVEMKQSQQDTAELNQLHKEQKAEKAFIQKWLPKGVNAVISDYWSRTPSRLYWALSFNFSESKQETAEQLERAKELLAIYGDAVNPNSSAIAHAKDFVKRYG